MSFALRPHRKRFFNEFLFFTQEDERARIKGSRDPLGLLPIWQPFGRGVERIKKRRAEHGKTAPIGSDAESYILGDQKAYGLWGLSFGCRTR